MKIFYFNIKGRAETARLLLNLGGKPFEDVRFMGEEWFGKYKAMSPSGQAPWLELDDGSNLCQGAAMQLYCASETGMLPSDNLQLGRTIELTDCLQDVCSTSLPSV